MAGPTPVSALIHAATMVAAGVYMVARSNILFVLAPATLMVVAVTGLATALFAASIAIYQYDIKKIWPIPLSANWDICSSDSEWGLSLAQCFTLSHMHSLKRYYSLLQAV